jgi:hypothetical protein
MPWAASEIRTLETRQCTRCPSSTSDLPSSPVLPELSLFCLASEEDPVSSRRHEQRTATLLGGVSRVATVTPPTLRHACHARRGLPSRLPLSDSP